MLFWHGSSTDHSLKDYAELNENGDSLIMFGSLILITSLSLLCSYYLLGKTSLTKELALCTPIVLMIVILSILNSISVKTQERAIVTCYIIEAARFPFYRQSQENPEGLIKILSDEKRTLGLAILAIILLAMMIIPYFLITR